MDPDYEPEGGRGRRAGLWIGVALGFTALGAAVEIDRAVADGGR